MEIIIKFSEHGSSRLVINDDVFAFFKGIDGFSVEKGEKAKTDHEFVAPKVEFEAEKALAHRHCAAKEAGDRVFQIIVWALFALPEVFIIFKADKLVCVKAGCHGIIIGKSMDQIRFEEGT
ncbi:hypothetical protein KKB18_13185, partial [bacterium]|nr:hypothetical protein [bacterium]